MTEKENEIDAEVAISELKKALGTRAGGWLEGASAAFATLFVADSGWLPFDGVLVTSRGLLIMTLLFACASIVFYFVVSRPHVKRSKKAVEASRSE